MGGIITLDPRLRIGIAYWYKVQWAGDCASRRCIVFITIMLACQYPELGKEKVEGREKRPRFRSVRCLHPVSDCLTFISINCTQMEPAHVGSKLALRRLCATDQYTISKR